MELRRLSICLLFFVLAVVSQCSEGRHSVQRRSSDFSAEAQNDEGDDGAQNDADGGNDAEEEDSEANGVITSKPDKYRLLIGRSVRLECQVSPAEGTVVSWSKGEEEKLFFGKIKVTKSEKYDLAPNSSDLIIKDLNFNDSGLYTCKVEQAKPVSITHVVTVEEPPRINGFTVTNDGQVKEGSDMLLTCQVSGTPKPSIIWSRQKQNAFATESLTEANGEFSENTFFMRNVTKDDSGFYYCYAVSDVGNDTARLEVNVFGKPRVYVHKPIINTDIGVEAILQCSTLNEPQQHHISWYKDRRLIEKTDTHSFSVKTEQTADGTVSTLTVTPKTDDDFGTFTCEASNVHGTHKKSIELVQRPVIESLSADGPKLTWTVHSYQPLEDIEVNLRQLGEDGQWMTYKVPLPSEKAHEYELIYVMEQKNLEGGTYEATVKVKNNKEWSHSDTAIINVESVAQPIQTASMLPGTGSGAHSIRPVSLVLNSIWMYLLVRML